MKGKILIFLTLFFAFITNCLIAQAQPVHNDPYKIDNFLYYNNEFKRQDVTSNKIKRVTVFNYKIANNKIKKKKTTPKYIMEFDRSGNPKRYQSTYTSNVWWWPALLQAIRVLKKRVDYHDYSFEYDSTNNLIYIKELLTSTTSANWNRNEIFYKYDRQNRVIEELISNRNIYKPGYKYRGTTYDNTTWLFKYNFAYDKSNHLTSVTTSYTEKETWDSTKTADTVRYTTTFDSLFARPTLPKGVKTDSLGRIIETTFHSRQ